MDLRRRTTAMSAALATILAVAVAAPAHATSTAQAPKPPTDAKKVAWQSRSGVHNFGPDLPDFVASTKVKDFDAQVTLTNPSIPKWDAGVTFRWLDRGRFYDVSVASDGNVTIYAKHGDKYDALKPPKFVAQVRKNAGQTNDIALYVRDTQALLFINKTYVDTFDVSEYNDYGLVALYAIGSDDANSGSLAYKNFIVRATAGSPAQAYAAQVPGATAAPATNSSIVVSAYRFNIERFGRPKGMDDPNAGCEMFDDSRPVKSVQAALKIENKSSTALTDWYAVFIKNDGKVALTCYYADVPVVPTNDFRNVTFQAFIEQSEWIDFIIVVSKDGRESNKLAVPKQ